MTRTDPDIATRKDAAGFGGVHDPSFFHDGCGVACVARLDGKAIHEAAIDPVSYTHLTLPTN